MEALMAERVRHEDRTSGAALVLFVVVQLAYLLAPTGVASAPAPDASIADWRALLHEDSVAAALRWDGLIPAINFIALLVPGSVGLRLRLIRSTSSRNVWPDLVVAGVLLVTMTVFIASATYAVLGLVPVDELSDSVLRATVMANWYALFGIGSMAVALFLGAASVAILRSGRSPRWLAWWGIATVATSIAGTIWVVSTDFDGPLLALNIFGRASFLAWVMAAGLWLLRATPVAAPATSATRAASEAR
jgi:succinate dehydrogenase hydrophobic anchor subunit